MVWMWFTSRNQGVLGTVKVCAHTPSYSNTLLRYWFFFFNWLLVLYLLLSDSWPLRVVSFISVITAPLCTADRKSQMNFYIHSRNSQQLSGAMHAAHVDVGWRFGKGVVIITHPVFYLSWLLVMLSVATGRKRWAGADWATDCLTDFICSVFFLMLDFRYWK